MANSIYVYEKLQNRTKTYPHNVRNGNRADKCRQWSGKSRSCKKSLHRFQKWRFFFIPPQFFQFRRGRRRRWQILKLLDCPDGNDRAQDCHESKVLFESDGVGGHGPADEKGRGNANLIEIECDSCRCGAFVSCEPLSTQ